MTRSFAALLYVLLGLGMAAVPARAMVFAFSFTDTFNPSMAITGRILGLEDNATGAASDVIIDTYASAYAGILPAGPLDFASFMADAGFNTFTVANGLMVSARFQDWATLPGNAQAYLQLVPGTGNQGFPAYFSAGAMMDSITTNDRSGATLTYAQVQDVTEPASLTVLLGSLIVLHLSRRAGRRRAPGLKTQAA